MIFPTQALTCLRCWTTPEVRPNAHCDRTLIVRRFRMHSLNDSWHLKTADSRVDMQWACCGEILWGNISNDPQTIYVRMPSLPKQPGVYLIEFSLKGRSRAYIGQTKNLQARLRKYAGSCSNSPPKAGNPEINMKGRFWRTFNNGGMASVYLLAEVGSKGCQVLSINSDDLFILERIALTTAFLMGLPLINEKGYPRPSSEDPLY